MPCLNYCSGLWSVGSSAFRFRAPGIRFSRRDCLGLWALRAEGYFEFCQIAARVSIG